MFTAVGKPGNLTAQWAWLKLKQLVAAVLLSAVLVSAPATTFAITARVLAEGGNSVDLPGYSTEPVIPAAGTLVLAWVVNNNDSTPAIPELSGNGLTWEMVATVTWGTVGTPKNRTTLFRAMGIPKETAESVGISFGAASQTGCSWSIVEFSSVDNSGANGSGAVIQGVSRAADDAPTSGLSIPLGTLSGPANVVAGGFSNSLIIANAITPASSFTASAGITRGSPSTSLRTEWKVAGSTAATNVGVTQAQHIDVAGIAVEIVAATTIIGNGTDPGNASLAPGAPSALVDSFTFQTSAGTTTVTGITVTMSPGSSAGIGLVEIIDQSGTLYGSLSNPSSDVVPVPLTTKNITATVTPTAYSVRITPKSHADMPAPPGGVYAVTAYVSNWTDANNHGGFDTGGTTVTIDNLSPANVTNNTDPTKAWGDAQVTVSWALPADTDLAGVVVLRRANNPVTLVPAEGVTYTVGNAIGNTTPPTNVACASAASDVSCTDPGLTNNTPYYYQLFARDSSGNYSAVGTAAGPVTPNRFQPDLMIRLSTETDADFLANNSYEATATSQVKALGVRSNKTASYTLRIQNDGTGPDGLLVTGTGNGSGFTVVYKDDAGADQTAAVTGAGFYMPTLAIGGYRDWTITVTPSGSGAPVPGGTVYDVLVTGTSASDAGKVDQVKSSTTSTSAHITLSKTADKTAYKPGDEITYTIVATNGTNLSDATVISLTEPIPGSTRFKVGSATFAAGDSTLTSEASYVGDENAKVTPESGGCSAPDGYDDCVKVVTWKMTGSMPPGTHFTCSLVVKVK